MCARDPIDWASATNVRWVKKTWTAAIHFSWFFYTAFFGLPPPVTRKTKCAMKIIFQAVDSGSICPLPSSWWIQPFKSIRRYCVVSSTGDPFSTFILVFIVQSLINSKFLTCMTVKLDSTLSFDSYKSSLFVLLQGASRCHNLQCSYFVPLAHVLLDLRAVAKVATKCSHMDQQSLSPKFPTRTFGSSCSRFQWA